ncbi:MAG: tripartite tricarboxylate transporter TctB family protein [Candidatus Rokuibacteriota bacterium]
MLTVDRVAGGALALLALGVLVESRVLPLGSLRQPGPAYMPVVLALLLLIFATVLIGLGGRSPHLRTTAWAEWRHAAAILGTCVFAALALERLGYRITTVVLLVFLLAIVERRRLVVTAVFALALTLGSYFLFATFLRVPLPRGPFGL